VEKIAPKNKDFYQELMAVSGTFASPEKQGLIIDKSRLWKPDRVLRQGQDKLAKDGRPIPIISGTKARKINLRSNTNGR